MEAFLARTLSWAGIADVVAETLEAWRDGEVEGIDAILAEDAEARVRARAVLARRQASR